MDHYLTIFVAAFLFAALIVFLRVRQLLGRSREKTKVSRALPRRRKRHRERAVRRAQAQASPALPREEIEKVFAQAETAAVNSALGDLEAERNPYAPDTRPGILWETHFNLVFMEWAGKPRPSPQATPRRSRH
ncbi:MAG: hypothetical protein EOO25_22145 [Comamonadaceae bacterium]|nr:MAG: hypothetical protein EOO25_22145 [Comamonadaceae bacterium]